MVTNRAKSIRKKMQNVNKWTKASEWAFHLLWCNQMHAHRFIVADVNKEATAKATNRVMWLSRKDRKKGKKNTERRKESCLCWQCFFPNQLIRVEPASPQYFISFVSRGSHLFQLIENIMSWTWMIRVNQNQPITRN